MIALGGKIIDMKDIEFIHNKSEVGLNGDSAFIGTMAYFLWPKDILAVRKATEKRGTVAQNPLTPEKYSFLKSKRFYTTFILSSNNVPNIFLGEFRKRIENEHCGVKETESRCALPRINKFMRSFITNARASVKNAKQRELNAMMRLNFEDDDFDENVFDV